MGVLVICVLVFIAFLYRLYCFLLFRLCIFILICFFCTSVRTTATEWKLNCSNNNNNNSHTHDSQPLDPTLSRINPANIPKPDILKMHFNIIIPSTPKPSKWSPTFVFYDEFCTRFSPIFGLYARPHSHLNHLSPEVQNTSPSPCSFTLPPVNFSLSCLNIPVCADRHSNSNIKFPTHTHKKKVKSS